MRPAASTRYLLLGILAGLAACTVGPDGRLPGEPPPNGGNVAASAVGTPFLVAFKVPLCLATLAVAAPGAAIAGLAPSVDGREAQLALGDGVNANCGPPWAVAP